MMTMEKTEEAMDFTILNAIDTLQFFGVPVLGMTIEPILRMARGQPNEPFITSLSKDSYLLRRYQRDFKMLVESRNLNIFSYYETQQSPGSYQVSLLTKLSKDVVNCYIGP